jgi:hypothetical protein
MLTQIIKATNLMQNLLKTTTFPTKKVALNDKRNSQIFSSLLIILVKYPLNMNMYSPDLGRHIELDYSVVM